MLRVYRIPWSTNVERVALALGHKGMAVEWVDVDPADRTPIREASGQELVPVLEDGDLVLTDSTRILHHLEELQPDPALFPRDPARAAEVEIFLDWFNRGWKREPNLITDAAGDAEAIARWGDRMQRRLELFEGLLQGREYLFGEFGAADCAAWPFLRYAVHIEPDDDEAFHRVLYERLDVSGHPRVSSWIKRVGQHPKG
ncbi:MAG: glutathione S-transferase family protein [Actinomycetota bacterium]|nr:glutathione S-transferase family protein [Actinomycetota bacterium]MDQ5834077.1 glutathione S-transferase family protein [Actinomycetota bacterium]